jgi:hypothetical protein
LATGDNYTLTPADGGSTIDVTVTATNSGGTSQAASTATNVIGGVAPTSTSVPVISGTTADGQTLSATHGTWGGTTPITYAYQWQRCDGSGVNCVDIGSATATDYALTSADVGSTIVVKVTATNAGGSASAQSVATAAIHPVAPANTAAPSISGSTEDGATLSADHGMWSGTTPISYAYQWQRCDSNGAHCTDIGSANSSTYTLGSPDRGSRIAVRVTATNAGGAANATSVATAVVATAGPVNTSAPSITGAPTDGQQLTGSRGSWTGSDPIAYTYQWQRCDSSGANCTDIGSATNDTYTLRAADIGSTVKFVVHASNGAGAATRMAPPTPRS